MNVSQRLQKSFANVKVLQIITPVLSTLLFLLSRLLRTTD